MKQLEGEKKMITEHLSTISSHEDTIAKQQQELVELRKKVATFEKIQTKLYKQLEGYQHKITAIENEKQ